jgi:Rho termination factor, N-terminal domain
MRRLFQLLLVGGLIAGAWALLRELLEQPSSEPSAPEPSRNKAELYREAQELEVEGRSKMTKDELAAAVARARRGGG